MIQKEIVLKIVKENPHGIRTEQVKIQSLYQGVSCADRHLRYLKHEGFIRKESLIGDKTDTWFPIQFEKNQAVLNI